MWFIRRLCYRALARLRLVCPRCWARPIPFGRVADDCPCVDAEAERRFLESHREVVRRWTALNP